MANGGFDDGSATYGTSSWSQVRSLRKWNLHGGASRTGYAKRSGSYGVRVADPDGGTAHATQLVRAREGVNYRVVGWARQVSGASAQSLYLDFIDGNYARIGSPKTASAGTSTAWHEVAAEAVSPSGTRFVRVIAYGGASSGVKSTVDWDDFRVTAW